MTIKIINKATSLVFTIAFLTFSSSVYANNVPLKGEMEKFHIFEQPVEVTSKEFSTIEGTSVSFQDLKGKVVVVNFWAEWCPPCIDEMPSLNQLQKELKDNGVEVITLSFDRIGTNRIKRFFTRQNLDHLTIYLDNDTVIAEEFDAFSLPATYIINKEGYIVGKYNGPANWGSDDAKSLILYYTK